MEGHEKHFVTSFHRLKFYWLIQGVEIWIGSFKGSKMRQMMDFVSQVGHQTAEIIRQEIESGGENEFEFKALASKFTVDIIASTGKFLTFIIQIIFFKLKNLF